MSLSDVVVLYRDRNLQLWGIPYRMRDDIGQQPRDLQEAAQRFADQRAAQRPGWVGAPIGNPTENWIWLGSPGWWGTMNRERQEETKAFLAGCSHVPGAPYEWCYIK